jgi:hypothetical protein
VLKNRMALRRLLWNPNELGLAQAYVTGEIDVEGDLADGLRRVWRQVRARHAAGAARPGRISASQRLKAVMVAARLGVLGPRPAAAPVQAKLAALVREPTARVWRLYMAGGALTFEERRMGVDQILAVRPTVDGMSRMPDTRVAWEINHA